VFAGRNRWQCLALGVTILEKLAGRRQASLAPSVFKMQIAVADSQSLRSFKLNRFESL
jgi:hypothetical protein